jgi:hypothetical protein
MKDLAEVLRDVRRAICRTAGHRRSLPAVHAIGGTWYSWCDRCYAKLVRIGPGVWRELTPEEMGRQPAVGADWGRDAPLEQESGAHPAKGGASPGYSANYFARKHGITRQQARQLIAAIGGDREKLNAAAEGLAGPGRASPRNI